MEQKLKITSRDEGKKTILILEGRLDANWAGFLDDSLKQVVEDSKYIVGLDLAGITFLSSAGIRILVKQNKAFRALLGELSVVAMSDNVKEVLDMVGLIDIFQARDVVANMEDNSKLKSHGYLFKSNYLSGGESSVMMSHINAEKVKTCSFKKEDSVLLSAKNSLWGIGIGAFGADFEDCSSRYGEFLALGKSISYLPSDSTSTPDYMTTIGKMIPEIQSIHHVGFEGNFSNSFSFMPESETRIPISAILDSIVKMGKHKTCAFLLMSESTGLIGTSLNTSPTEGKMPFEFPAIRNNMNFTTEPAYNKSLAVVLGIVSTDASGELKSFLRPMGDGLMGHLHCAVFPYTPMQKEDVDYTTVLESLFSTSEVLDVLHLINDNREINGLGESTFKSGHCWTQELITTEN